MDEDADTAKEFALFLAEKASGKTWGKPTGTPAAPNPTIRSIVGPTARAAIHLRVAKGRSRGTRKPPLIGTNSGGKRTY